MAAWHLVFAAAVLGWAGVVGAAEPEPLIVDAIPEQPHLNATLTLADGKVLKNVAIMRWGSEEDPTQIVVRFAQETFKSSVRIGEVTAIEFEKAQTTGAFEKGGHLMLTLANGASKTIRYLEGLGGDMKIIYLDEFSQHLQLLYVSIYEDAPQSDGKKQLKIKKIEFGK